ncbi:hypothetical protein LCGC14_0974120 [marine sediment metagenome]|uniref:Histidine kinase N-terminal 7TM region domain-containing protein n=1 Tax=marine sediment metagenome TaxID=412755 RepID=A0A0F9NAP7_9ZZZZ
MANLPSLSIWIFAWIFLFIGIASLVVLIVYSKYGREISVRLSIISIVFSSIFLGFGFHFLLLSWNL